MMHPLAVAPMPEDPDSRRSSSLENLGQHHKITEPEATRPSSCSLRPRPPQQEQPPPQQQQGLLGSLLSQQVSEYNNKDELDTLHHHHHAPSFVPKVDVGELVATRGLVIVEEKIVPDPSSVKLVK
jgi:hypothetical protein